MSPSYPRTAELIPVAWPARWAEAEPVTSPIPIVEPDTNPIPVIGDRPRTDPRPDAGRARQALVLTGLVLLVLLSGLLLALGGPGVI
jgi:hypothetical protein